MPRSNHLLALSVDASKIEFFTCAYSYSRVSQRYHQLWPKIQRGIGRMVQVYLGMVSSIDLLCVILTANMFLMPSAIYIPDGPATLIAIY